MSYLLERCLFTWWGLPWSCDHIDVFRKYRGPIMVGAKVNLPHPIMENLFEPWNYSPQLSWGTLHGRLGGFLKQLARPVCKRLLLYAEVPDKAHRILVLVFGSHFLWERFAYTVGVVGTLGHLLKMTSRNDVVWLVASFYRIWSIACALEHSGI